MRRATALAGLLVAAFTLGCGLGPKNTLDQHSLALPRAEHAISVPLQAFAVPEIPDGVNDLAYCQPPASIRLTYAAVEVAPDALYVAGEPLDVSVTNGVVSIEKKRGQLVAPLYSRLLALAESSKDAASQGCAPWVVEGEAPQFKGRLLVTIDSRVPWETVEEVMFSAAQAQFGQLWLRVHDPSAAPGSITAPVQRVPAERAVRVRSEGAVELEILPSPFVEADPQNSSPEIVAIDDLATRLGTSGALVQIEPAPGLPAEDVVHAIDAVAGAGAPVVLVLSGASAPPGLHATTRLSDTPLPADAQVSVLQVRIPTLGEARKASGPPPIATVLQTGGAPAGIEQVVERHRNQIKYCYQRELAKNPTLAGSVEVQVAIGPDGTVSDAFLASSDLGNPAVEKCVVGRFLRMRFPAQNTPVTHRFPFTFQPD
ncbi:MAG: AgmX/PglI C-terminal domain-containing protein [Myxococcota bacterium]